MIPEGNYITSTLITMILAVSIYAFANKKVFQALILHPVSVLHKKEYYRILSSALVHNNILHLLINILMLYVYCSGLEESGPGPRITLVIAIVSSLLAGHLLSQFIYRKDITYSSAGASGVAIGCMCSYLILHPFENHVSLPFVDNIPNIFSAVGYLFIIMFYNRKFNRGKIDYSIHVGGGLGGAAASIIMHPEVLSYI